MKGWLGIAASVLTSRTGMFVVTGLSAFVWHTFDKSSAVRKTVIEYVAKEELAAERAARKATQYKLDRANKAGRKLVDRITISRENQINADTDITAYIESLPTVAGCTISSDLLDLVRQPK